MAVAGCINAYDCSGNLIRTLEQLQSSNIGVGVQYTAPNPLDDKKINYIKYTDKCGCTCTLSGENEILIYSTNGVIKNLSLTNDDTNERVIVKWNDIFGSNWLKTVVRYKTGSAPTSLTDGTLAVEETTKNQYATNGYGVSGLSDDTTYYFSVFGVDTDGTVINVQNGVITTDFGWKPGANTLAYFPFKDDANDHSGKGVSLSNTQYISKQTLGYKWQFSQGQTGQSYSLHFNNSNVRIISMWYKVLNSSGNSNICTLSRYGVVGYNTSHGNANLNNKIATFTNSSWNIGGITDGMSFNEWHHISIGYDGSKILVSKDGVQSTLYNGAGYNFGDEVSFVGGGNNTNLQVLISDCICENLCWTQAEILKYFNKTKSKYGL